MIKLDTVSTTVATIPLLFPPEARLFEPAELRLLAPDAGFDVRSADLAVFPLEREPAAERPEERDFELPADLVEDEEREDPLFDDADELPDLDPDELDLDFEEPPDEDFTPEELREDLGDLDVLPDLDDLPGLGDLEDELELPDREDEPAFFAPEDLLADELGDFLDGDEPDLLPDDFVEADEPEREPEDFFAEDDEVDRDPVDFLVDVDEAFLGPADLDDDEDLDPDDFFVPVEDFDPDDFFVADEDLDPEERFVAAIVLFSRNVFIRCDRAARWPRKRNCRPEYSNPIQTLVTRF